MKNWLIGGAALLLTTATPALAQNAITDNFNAEGAGATVLNYNSFAKFDVTKGSVDLLHDPNGYGIGCVGGSGSCVDLDGSTNQGGTLTTKNALSFLTGSHVTLSFDLSGNQRGAGPDNFFAGFDFTNPVDLNNYTLGGGFGGVTIPSFPGVTSISSFESIGDSSPFTHYSLSFIAGTAGSAKAFIGTNSSDNQGPILDNFSFSTSGVPEPASWALMIIGFGAVGGTLRRRATRKAMLPSLA